MYIVLLSLAKLRVRLKSNVMSTPAVLWLNVRPNVRVESTEASDLSCLDEQRYEAWYLLRLCLSVCLSVHHFVTLASQVWFMLPYYALRPIIERFL